MMLSVSTTQQGQQTSDWARAATCRWLWAAFHPAPHVAPCAKSCARPPAPVSAPQRPPGHPQLLLPSQVHCAQSPLFLHMWHNPHNSTNTVNKHHVPDYKSLYRFGDLSPRAMLCLLHDVPSARCICKKCSWASPTRIPDAASLTTPKSHVK